MPASFGTISTFIQNATVPTLAAGDNPLSHVVDHPLLHFGGHWVISNVTVLLLIVMAVLFALLIPAAKKIATGKSGTWEDYTTKGTSAGIVEVICLYLRDETFKPVLKEYTDKYTPTLWTFFWFILISNLVGLVPVKDLAALIGPGWNVGHFGGTATQSIFVTAVLAVFAFVFYTSVALIKDPVGYIKHMTGGAPPALWVIIVPVEILGTFIKPFALAIRLFANMTGGHTLLAVMMGFVPKLIIIFSGMFTGGVIVGTGLAIIPLIGSIAVMFLEILVAFIQAYIFTFLVAVFLGQLIVHDHDDHHAHEGQGHGEAHAH